MPITEPDQRQALTHLIPALTRLARILTRDRDQAEDLTQEALLQVWSRLQSGAEVKDLRPYLMTTLRHAARRRTMPSVELTEEMIPAVEGEAAQNIARDALLNAIDRLPGDQARLLRYMLNEDPSYAQMARVFDLPLGTIMSRLSRARQRLRTELEGDARPPETKDLIATPARRKRPTPA